MLARTTLSQLTNEDLLRSPAWQTLDDWADEEDKRLAPVQLDERGLIPKDVQEVWCLCRATFANGSEHLACAMCRGDCNDGPLACSVWNGDRDVRIILPPAPSFVLAVEGPDAFAAAFNAPAAKVFPIRFEVIPGFAASPERRAVYLDTTGVDQR